MKHRTGYIKSYYTILDDEKLLAVPPEYRWAWHIATLYSGSKQRDGWLSAEQAKRLILYHDLPLDCWDRLVDARLMELADGDYVVHDYLDHQTSSAEIDAKRQRLSQIRAQAGRKGGFASGQQRANRSKTEYAGSKTEPNVKQDGEQTRSTRREEVKKEEETPSLRSGVGETVLTNTARARERVEGEAQAQLRRRLVKERAVEIARHWSTLSGKATSLKVASQVAEFQIALPQLFDLLDRCWEAGSYDLNSPVIRTGLQRLESELRKVEGDRRGVVSLGERLSVISGQGGAGATG